MDKTDVIFLIQDSQGTSSKTVGNIKTVLKKIMPKLRSVSSDFKFAVAKYATSRRMSCFGNADATVNYMDNEYQHGGSGLNLLNLALSKMVLKQFEKRPDDRKDDTAKILVIFSDGNAQNENGDIMDTSTLEQTARSLKEDNSINMIGVLIHNAEKASRIQQLKGIVSEPDNVIDTNAARVTSYNNIADLLAFRVKRLVGCLGKNVI
ncbi:uncharacterized protein LOC110069466 [Orbicella faveolata]|uniref:uncharacterized protein LOC110069466 n=1 Tax=Orbicella faveolata TaxID=48498 RepID=UPI0009E5AD15|nr:uncharacterized protein LOC110069466 [Orbicella faveolata]